MLELSTLNRILVVAAHPDDELLGLGATLHKIKQKSNCLIRVVILGEGITSRSNKRESIENEKKLLKHKKNIIDAKKILGYDSLVTYKYPDNQFDTIPLLSIIKTIEKEKIKFYPDIVLTHHNGDLNIDHQITFQSVSTAFRSLPGENFKGIITFETPSGTEWITSNDPRKFNPNIFIELKESEIDKKIEAMECYQFEKRIFPHPRSPKALKNRAIMWGVSIGVNYAEAFQLIKLIIRDEN